MKTEIDYNIPSAPKMGDKFYIKNGCPECSRDLVVVYGVCEYCIVWEECKCPSPKGEFEHKIFKEKYGCDYRIMGG